MNSNDIIIVNDSVEYRFNFLEWDTNFFNRNSYSLNIEKTKLGVDLSLVEMFKEKLQGSFVTIKLNTQTDYRIIQFLQQCGFYYVDTEVTLKYKPLQKEYTNDTSELLIENIHINQNLPYEALGKSFSKTRFHEDIHIDNKLADLLWINYMKNYVPSASKLMFVAKFKGEVAGTILVNINGQNANLFFVAVLEKFRGQKIGHHLIQYVVKYFENYELSVGTQCKNVGALNFYIMNGFSKVDKTSTVLHGWF